MKIEAQEKKWILWFSLIILVITTIPYIIAHSHYGNSYIFTGFIFGVEDGNSYIAKMLSGANGAWLFRSPYSSEAQNGFFAYFPYILLGKLSSPPAQHEQLVALYQLFRWLAVGALTYWVYRFTAIFFNNQFYRKMATIVITVGGGLGWLSVLGVTKILKLGLPLEFYSPETFGFLSVLGLPHLAAARALLLCGLVHYLNAANNRGRILAGLCWFGIGFFQPLALVTGWGLLLVHLGLMVAFDWYKRTRHRVGNPHRWRFYFKTAVYMVLISSPWVIYNFLSFSFDPYLSGWEGQNILKSPPIWDYLFSFGLLLPFCLLGLLRMLRRPPEAEYLLTTGWIIAFPIFAYLPYNLQRRLPEGIWVAIVITAFWFFEKNLSLKGRKIPIAVSVLSLLSSLMIFVGGLQVVITPKNPVFRQQQEVSAFQYLDEFAGGSVVAASYPISNALPAWAPVYVLAGHGPESVNFEQTTRQVQQLFAGALNEDKLSEFLGEYNVQYLFWGPEEQEMGNWSPFESGLFTPVYQDPPYYILRVNETQSKK